MTATRLLGIFLFFQFILIGCSASRFQKKGEIVNKNFKVEIPFNYQQEVILVDVVIEGKSYNFIWDTGAELNVIDESIADQINVKSKGNTSVKGSDNTSQKMGRLAIPNMKIGTLEVQGSVAVISNFSSISRFLGCLDIKGIIGNNIMHRANMQIDFEKQIITLTDQEAALDYSESAHVVKMNAGKIGNVKLKMAIGDHEQLLTFDTGYGGQFKTSNSYLVSGHPQITSTGITGASLHSINRGSVSFAYISEGEVAGIPFTNKVVVLNESGASLVGNKFFEHFTISTLWDEDKLIFDPIRPILPDTIRPFELKLSPNFNSAKIEVAKLYTDHTAFEAELIGWQVDKINEEDVANFTMEELCDYWDKLIKEVKPLDSYTAEISNEQKSKLIHVKRITFDHTKISN